MNENDDALYASTFLDDTEKVEEPSEYTADGDCDGGYMFFLNKRMVTDGRLSEGT